MPIFRTLNVEFLSENSETLTLQDSLHIVIYIKLIIDLLWVPLAPGGECRSADFADINDKYIRFSADRMLNILGKSLKPQVSLYATFDMRLALYMEGLLSVIYGVGYSLVGRAI